MNIRKYKPILGEGKVNVLVSDGSISVGRPLKLSNVEELFGFACAYLHMNIQAEEFVYVIGMDSKLHPIGISEVGHGTVDACLVSVRSVMIRLLLMGAVRFALLHNHPSGDPFPSKEDRDLTDRLKEAGDLIGIDMIEHLVIGSDCYTSFSEMNLL